MNIKKVVFIIIIFFCVLISCKKTAQREKEPNDNFLTANKIEPDMVIEGLLNTPSDCDYYRFDIVSPIAMDITLTSVKGINHAIGILKDKNGEQIIVKYIDDSRKSSPEIMCNMFFDIGTYYIEILHGDRDIPQGNEENYYELRLTSKDFDDEEKESNDNYESANPTETGKEIKGYFSPAFNKLNHNIITPSREEDWYYFTIDLVDDIPVLLDAAITGVPDVKSTLYLFDGDRNELAISGAGGTGDGERLEGIGIMKSGKYYIMAASNFESNNNTPYILLLTARNYDYSTELEPNSNFNSANLLMEDEISAKIFPEGDKDYYLYKIQSKDTSATDGQYLYRIGALSENINLILKVFDENRKKLFEIDNLKGAGKEIMPDAFLKKNFYIEVSGKGAVDPASEYKLSVSGIPYSDEYEIEPNDTKEAATRIKSNKITGFISKKDDKDYYLLEYKKRVRIKFTLNGIKDSELKISVTDPLGFVTKTESVNGADSVSFNEMIDSKGYLIIESPKENFEEPYTIELGE